MADHTERLRSIDSSVGVLNTEFKVMQRTMYEAMSKQLTVLDLVQKSIPTAIGHCWGAEAPILLLDGLGRQTSLPIMLASSPDVRAHTPSVIPLWKLEADFQCTGISRRPSNYASRHSWIRQN